MHFILDCSVTMSWCFQDEITPYTKEVMLSLEDHSALVPTIWKIEVANCLYTQSVSYLGIVMQEKQVVATFFSQKSTGIAGLFRVFFEKKT